MYMYCCCSRLIACPAVWRNVEIAQKFGPPTLRHVITYDASIISYLMTFLRIYRTYRALCEACDDVDRLQTAR